MEEDEPREDERREDERREDEAGWMTVEGIFIPAQEGRIQASAGVVKGRSDSFSLQWPVEAELGEEAFFYLSVPAGSDQISGVQLQLIGAKGEVWKRLVEVNRAVALNEAPAHVLSAELHFAMARVPFEVTLGELVLAVPRLMDRKQGLEVNLPWQGDQLLPSRFQTQEVRVLENRRGFSLSYWPAELSAGRIETTLPLSLDHLEKLRLSYQLPWDWLGADGCVLDGEFVFAGGSVRRSFCLARASGNQEIPVEKLGLLGSDKGQLEKVVWYLRKPKGVEGLLGIGVSVSGRSMLSVWDQLRNSALVRLGTKTYFGEFDASPSFLENMAFSRSFSLNLPDVFLADYLQQEGSLTVEDNPWVTVDVVAVMPRDEIGWEQWWTLVEPIEFPRSFNWGKLLALLAVLGLGVFVIRKGWWPGMWGGVGRVRSPHVLVASPRWLGIGLAAGCEIGALGQPGFGRAWGSHVALVGG